MKTKTIIFLALIAITGCKNSSDQADAFGNFETAEVIISAETSGKILSFEATEGTRLEEGTRLALIDTTMFNLQKAEINAGIKSVKTRLASVNAQNEILRQQISNLTINVNRIEKMLKDDAATQKQLDDLTGQVSVFRKQIEANNTQIVSVNAEAGVFESRKATLNEQIKRSCVLMPLSGTIIEKYSEEGEMTAAGKPLAKIADLSLIKLKVYVSGGQLANIKNGEKCTVRTDSGEKGYVSFPGTITHVAEKAEFTPKIIQTKEERVTLVYAVTIDVVNDGTLKSGMPGEAIFAIVQK